MKLTHLLALFVAVIAAAAALAADPTGNWQWTTHSPGGDIETMLKLEWADGKLAGAYSNQFGATAIRKASFQADVIEFEVVRNLGGKEYVVRYHGKLEGDHIRGRIEAPGHDGGDALKIEWTASRMPKKG